MESNIHYEPDDFSCIPHMLKREMQAFQLFYSLFSIDTVIILDDFDIKCFGYRKVKTHCIYMWHGLTS